MRGNAREPLFGDEAGKVGVRSQATARKSEQDDEPTVLVTGGTGFLGRPLVEYLVERGECVRVLGRRPVVRWRHHPRVEHLRGDIADPKTAEVALAGIQKVYHLAAATQGDWSDYKRTTVDGTALLLKKFAEQGGGRFLLVSSSGNYDILRVPRGGIVDEDCPLDPNPEGRASYARAKILAESVAHSYLSHPHVKLTIVRPGTIYGPGMENPLVGVAFSVLRGRLLLIAGMGEKPLDYLYIEDAVQGLVKIMESDETVGRIYNLLYPDMPTQNEFLRLYKRFTGDRRPVLRIPLRRLLWLFPIADRLLKAVRRHDSQLHYKARRLAHPVYYSTDRLQKDTGFLPRIGPEEGLSQMFQR